MNALSSKSNCLRNCVLIQVSVASLMKTVKHKSCVLKINMQTNKHKQKHTRSKDTFYNNNKLNHQI